MKIVFLGSASFSCPSLRALVKCGMHEVVGVVTQPDRPRGRGMRVAPSPMRSCVPGGATKVLVPEDVNSSQSLDCLRGLNPDLLVVAAYGQRMSAELIDLAPRGTINVHPSLLPRYRGAAPIQWALANGDPVTGVTTMHVVEEMDAGDIIMQREVPIASDDNAGSLSERLAEVGADMLVETVNALAAGTAKRVPQDSAKVVRAPKLKKADGRISWDTEAEVICNRIRAFNPWPCCFCEPDSGSGNYLRVLTAVPESCPYGPTGDVMEWSGSGPLVRTARNAVRLIEVQPDGGRVMSGAAWMRGRQTLVRFG